MNSSHAMLRFVSVVVLLLTATIYLESHRRAEVVPQHPRFETFPRAIGGWTGRDTILTPDVLALLGPDGDYLTRMYNRPGANSWMDLYIAYYPTQKRGDSLHSPKNCLPGAGWSFLDSSQITLQAPGLAPVNAGRYIIGNGAARQLVYYWYQAHGRTFSSEYLGKYYLLADAVRLNRTDGALVRVITPIQTTETVAAAETRLKGFMDGLLPLLPAYIPE